MNKFKPEDLQRANYELFILSLTVLSLFNLLVMIFAQSDDIRQIAFIVNVILSLIFLGDFLYRLRIAEDNRGYFFKGNGWLDLIGSVPIPGFNLARIWRVFRAIRMLRSTGSREVLVQIRSHRADTALLFIALAVLYILDFGSILILRTEAQAPNALITTAGDAMWWVLVTISTVGYGDLVPVTAQGRFVAVFVIFAGVGVFGTLSGFLANSFLGQRTKQTATEVDTVNEPILDELRRMYQAQSEATLMQKEDNARLQARLDALEQLLQQSGPR